MARFGNGTLYAMLYPKRKLKERTKRSKLAFELAANTTARSPLTALHGICAELGVYVVFDVDSDNVDSVTITRGGAGKYVLTSNLANNDACQMIATALGLILGFERLVLDKLEVRSGVRVNQHPGKLDILNPSYQDAYAFGAKLISEINKKISSSVS